RAAPWAPAFSVSVTGVTPLDVPSTTTSAPGGLLFMLNVPVGASAGAKKYFRPAYPTIARTTTAAAAMAAMGPIGLPPTFSTGHFAPSSPASGGSGRHAGRGSDRGAGRGSCRSAAPAHRGARRFRTG